jgi:predicted nucleotide-binding protein
MELGYFVGVLGRGRVRPLYVEGVERPSDMDGLVYVALDTKTDAWRWQLARELKHAFPDLDMNNVA